MGLQLGINLDVLEKSADVGDIESYLNSLATEQEIYLNGPESPGPCLRCLALHGTTWSRIDPRKPRVPLHPSCYCRLMSYRKNGKRVKRTKTYKKYEFLGNRIRRMTIAQKEAVMGKQMARLHRLGIMETKDLVSQTTGIRTLESVAKSRLGISGKDVSKLTDGELIRLFNARQ